MIKLLNETIHLECQRNESQSLTSRKMKMFPWHYDYNLIMPNTEIKQSYFIFIMHREVIYDSWLTTGLHLNDFTSPLGIKIHANYIYFLSLCVAFLDLASVVQFAFYHYLPFLVIKQAWGDVFVCIYFQPLKKIV